MYGDVYLSLFPQSCTFVSKVQQCHFQHFKYFCEVCNYSSVEFLLGVQLNPWPPTHMHGEQQHTRAVVQGVITTLAELLVTKQPTCSVHVYIYTHSLKLQNYNILSDGSCVCMCEWVSVCMCVHLGGRCSVSVVCDLLLPHEQSSLELSVGPRQGVAPGDGCLVLVGLHVGLLGRGRGEGDKGQGVAPI